MKILKISLIVLLATFFETSAQVYSDKVVGKKNEQLIDSLKVAEYPYSLPIWGAKATAKGFKLPYSAGLSVNWFWQESDILISNLNVGFNNGPQYNLEEVVRFKGAVATSQAVNFRPDVWVFPFLNVYGIIGSIHNSTAIDAGVWIPDGDNNWSEVYQFETKAEFDGVTAGIGITPTIGVGGGFIALDMNVAWTDIPSMEKPAVSFVFGPRVGKSFKFKKPEQNIAVWVGAFRLQINGDTDGSIDLAEVLSLDGAQARVDTGLGKVAENQILVNNWWESLSPIEQANPGNIARFNTANRALDAAGNLLNGLDGALSTAETSTVQYSIQKEPADMWNFLIGTQYQHNKHFMLRAEYGFLGTREQFLLGLQYRFGL